MINYLDTLKLILNTGSDRTDRTGVGTRSAFGLQLHFDLNEGFPLITTKKIYVQGFVCELLWFLKGDTNIKFLNDHQVRIWDAWADEHGDLGPVYGHQWRSWQASDGQMIDQISELIEQIKKNPFSRRLIVSSWNVGELQKMALPPCHLLFQFYVSSQKLSCQLYQRSGDMFLGVPFNIASYALLTHMVAQQCNLGVGNFIWTAGDAHIYHNHFDAVSLQLKRKPKQRPNLVIKRAASSIFEYEYKDFVFHGYDPHPTIKADVAV